MNMPLVLLNRRRRFMSSTFSPSSLFAASEQGVWYDPSDLTTLFQDSAGTTPVTATGQTVGLMLDKSKGLALGAELVSNGNFNSGSTGWTLGASWAIVDGVAVKSGVGVDQLFTTIPALEIGKTYEFSVDQAWAIGPPGLLVRVGASGAVVFNGAFAPTSGNRAFVRFTATAAATRITIGFAGNTSTGTFDNISVKEIAGNHATQATTASRPIYGINPITGTRNLLIWSEDLRNTAGAGETRPWFHNAVTISANTTLSPTGTLTADTMASLGDFPFCYQGIPASVGSTVSGSFWIRKTSGLANGSLPNTSLEFRSNTFLAEYSLVLDTNNGAAIASSGWGTAPALNASMQSDGDYWRVSFSSPAAPATTTSARLYINVSGGFLNGTRPGSFPASSVILWGAQLETGSTATAYQRVTDQYNVTEAGVASAHYLRFDGSDDFMVTNTITPAINKVQVFAGLRKLSDAAAACLVEFGISVSSSNGTFALFAPGTNGAADYYAGVRGSLIQNLQTATTYPAPITNVISVLGDISGDLSILRANAVQAAQSTADAGTGNFLAYPIYIGRRAGTTFPINGQLYSLIVRFGANLTTDTITSTETYVNGKTGAYA